MIGDTARIASTPQRNATVLGPGPQNDLAALPTDVFTESVPDAVIQRLPKVDLHRHLEGSLSPEAFIAIADKYGIPIPSHDLETLRPFLQETKDDKTLLDFLKKFDTIGLAFKNAAACKDITEAVINEAAKDNVKYLELRFSPMYMAGDKLDLHDVMDAVAAGAKDASEKTGTKVKLIAIVERQMGPEKAKIVEGLAEEYKDRGVVGLDLANDEYHYPPGPYAEVFQKAKSAGLHITVHAGEAGGADNVKTSIDALGAERIGHGVRTFEDPAVEQEVRERRIPLELCPTSNIQTGSVGSWDAHPLKKFYEEGIPVTINTDDPGVSGIDLSNEYKVAMQHWGLSLNDVEHIILNGVDAAFVPQDERQAMHAAFEQEFGQIANGQ